MNVRELKPTPNDSLVRCLRKLLEQAESGELQGMAWVAVKTRGKSENGCLVSSGVDALALLGESCLLSRAIAREIETDVPPAGRGAMGPHSARITAADEYRLHLLREIGCIVSAVYFGRWRTPGDVHHILCGSRRAALNQHQRTIMLHPWYHRGLPPCDAFGRRLTYQQAYDLMGPSMFHTKFEFVERFGTEAELLEMTNALIARMEAA